MKTKRQYQAELGAPWIIHDVSEFKTLSVLDKPKRIYWNDPLRGGDFTLSQNPEADDGVIWFNGYCRDGYTVIPITPEMAGAKGDYYLEDGTKNPTPTDDTEAFQKAINALGYPTQDWNPQSLKGGGGKVLLWNRDYLIKDTLLIAGGITIEGVNAVASRIHFEPDTLKDLFVSDPAKETRAGLEYVSFQCKEVTIIGDAVFGDKAGTCFNFEKQKKSKLSNVNIYNFTAGVFYGESTYYIKNDSVNFRANFKNIIAGTPTGSGSGPLVFVGGSMTGVASEAETSSKLQECYVQVHKSAQITFVGTSMEQTFGYPTTSDFAMIRGDYDGTLEIGKYALINTYHEGTAYIAEYAINSAHGGNSKIDPLSCNSPLLRIVNYNNSDIDSSDFATSRTSKFTTTLAGDGLDTGLVVNKNLADGAATLNGSHSLVEDATTQFIYGIDTLRKDYAAETLNTFPWYIDIPDIDFQKFGGRTLTFNVIDKITNGVSKGIQLYINGSLYRLKSTDIRFVDYGNGFIMRKIDAFIPYGSDATNLRAGIKIDAAAGCVYNLAYISITVDGTDCIFPQVT